MILKFVDREDELKELENLYWSEKAQFVLIYGRRRIGKTELYIFPPWTEYGRSYSNDICTFFDCYSVRRTHSH